MKRSDELNLMGDPYRGISLTELSPKEATHLLEAVQILHDWVTSRYGAAIHEYLLETEKLESTVDDEPDHEIDF
jgi:Mn-dependent DtxR family transcriptional regulator